VANYITTEEADKPMQEGAGKPHNPVRLGSGGLVASYRPSFRQVLQAQKVLLNQDPI